MTTETLTFDDIADELDEMGVEYTRRDRLSDREMIDVPGYGGICYDDRSGVEPGYFIRPHDGGADMPITGTELQADIAELGQMAAAWKSFEETA